MMTDEMLTGRRWIIYSAPGTGIVYGYAVAWTDEGVVVVNPPKTTGNTRWDVLREPEHIIWDNILELHRTEWNAKQCIEEREKSI